MKIAIFIDQFPVRSQTFVLNQITGLIDLGHDVSIVALHAGNLALLQQPNLINYHLAPRCIFLMEIQPKAISKLVYRLKTIASQLFNPGLSNRVLRGLNPLLGKQALNLMLSTIAANQASPLDFDWLICHFGPNGNLANRLRKLGVVKGAIATFFHGVDMSSAKGLHNNLQGYQQLFSETELLLPIDHLWRDKLIKLGSKANKTVVHRMGVNLRYFSPPDKMPSNASTQIFKLFSVARFTEKKGLHYAIQSLTYLPADMAIRYEIGGYGDLEQELRLLVTELDLTDKVIFLGPLGPEQVKQHMLACDVFLQPSITANDGDTEGVPVAIMEAMAMGCAVIATQHGGIPELIENDQQGLLVAEKDAKAIADKLSLLYYNHELVGQMGSQARQRVEVIADIDRLNQQLVVLLNEHRHS